jgi:hypothetical protein
MGKFQKPSKSEILCSLDERKGHTLQIFEAKVIRNTLGLLEWNYMEQKFIVIL